MRWAVGAVALALVAVVAVNVLLLAYGGDRHDPVGRLSPVTNLPALSGKPRPLPAPTSAGGDGGDSHGSDD